MYICKTRVNEDYSCNYGIGIDASGLSEGTYSGTAHSSVGDIPVVLTVRPPDFSVAPESLALASTPGCGISQEILTITNNESQWLDFRMSDDQVWIYTPGGRIGYANPGASISTAGYLSFSASGLDAGTYSGNVYIKTGGTSKTVPVTLSLNQTPSITNGSGNYTDCTSYEASFTLTPNSRCTTTYTYWFGADPQNLADAGGRINHRQ